MYSFCGILHLYKANKTTQHMFYIKYYYINILNNFI